MNTDESLDETAKAVQEVAKTAGKAIDAATRFGGFFSTYISGTLEQGMGIFEDKLKYMRWERQVRLMANAEQLLRDVGLDKPSRAIPLKLAIPLIEAASLEDDDFLQDLWARLLVNSANGSSGVTLQRAYISILEQLNSLDVFCLQKIYSLPYDETRHVGIVVSNLPATVQIAIAARNDSLVEPSDQIKLALANLARVGCIAIAKSYDGGEIFSEVNPTLLGKYFVEACTLQVD